MNDVKGFLMIDQCKNTVIIPWDAEELVDVLRRYKLYDSIKPHSGLKTLDIDVRAYLKGNYVSAITRRDNEYSNQGHGNATGRH